MYLAIAGADRLRQAVATGVPQSLMPGFAASAGGMLTDQQIDIIVNGMLSRFGAGERPDPATLPAYATRDPGDAQRGGAPYASYCASCHGADGKGGEKGGSIVDGSYLALVSDQALRLAVVCGRPDLGMPDWRGAGGARPMSDQEISDVVAWLIAQRPRIAGQDN